MELKEVQEKIQDLIVNARGNFSVSFHGCCATVYREDNLLVAGHVLDVWQELRKEARK